ncbi:MAG: GtrA family protein [Clostridia bacterium]|nr:GtrA family protein [Clostridia bacterium]
MKKRLKALYTKHKQLILYLLFGVITTVVSLLACYLTLKIGVRFMHDEHGEPTELLDILGSTTQWVSGVLVAFFTNKLWVFKSAEHGKKATLKQFSVFCGSRVGTYFLEVVINLIAIQIFEWLGYTAFTLNLLVLSLDITERVWAKLISSVVVVITNYYISKLLVFRKKKNKTEE